MELKKKTVLVTGSPAASAGQLRLAFGRAGYNVALNASKSAAQLEETKSLLESEAIPVLAVLADVSDYEGCKLLFAKIEETFGMVDVLVNNAGISHIGLFTDMTPAEWNHVLDVNLGSVLNCTHLAVPAMVSEKDGVILNISSMWGEVGCILLRLCIPPLRAASMPSPKRWRRSLGPPIFGSMPSPAVSLIRK